MRPQYGQKDTDNKKGVVETGEAVNGKNTSQTGAIDSLQKIDVNSLFSAAAGQEVKSGRTVKRAKPDEAAQSDGKPAHPDDPALTASSTADNEFASIFKSLTVSEDKSATKVCKFFSHLHKVTLKSKSDTVRGSAV